MTEKLVRKLNLGDLIVPYFLRFIIIYNISHLNLKNIKSYKLL